MTNKKCSDCNGELTQIKLFGRGWENPVSGVAIDIDLSYYAEGEAERSSFSGMVKQKGNVESYLCTTYWRIFLFGTKD